MMSPEEIQEIFETMKSMNKKMEDLDNKMGSPTADNKKSNLDIEQKMSSVQTEMMNLRSSVEDDKIKFEEKLVLLE